MEGIEEFLETFEFPSAFHSVVLPSTALAPQVAPQARQQRQCRSCQQRFGCSGE